MGAAINDIIPRVMLMYDEGFPIRSNTYTQLYYLQNIMYLKVNLNLIYI